YEIRILGHAISAEGIKMDPKKLEILTKWEEPVDGAGLASFLGLGCFIRDHVRHYAELTASLEAEKARTKSKAPIIWTDRLRADFKACKIAFATAPFLKYPDMNRRFVFASDASWLGIGGILYQPDDDKDTITPNNIVAIASKELSVVQQR